MHRLGNQVILVKGCRRSALYDLHRCRLVRVPGVIGRWVDDQGRMVIPSEAVDTPVVQDLLARRFVVEADPFEERRRLPMDATNGPPRIPPLHTITLQASLILGEQLEWAAQAIAWGARGLTVYGGDQSPEDLQLAIFEAIRTQRTPAFEVVETIPGWPGQWAISSLFNAAGTLIARRRRIIGTGAFGAKLRVNETHFSLLHQSSEMTGQVFIDSQGALTPHWAEPTLCYGTIYDTTAVQLIDSETYRRVQTAKKDQRAKCRDCELRYACVHPLSDRTDPHDLQSAPASCLYDPAAPASQAHLFAHE